ncbi:MAG: flippase [Thermoanaerobaculum sp.]
MWRRYLDLFRARQAFISNAAGLYLDTLTSYLFPLITLPYLVRVLGPKGFGLVAFAQSFTSYLSVVTDYAMTLTGTREVAQKREDPEMVSQALVDALALRLGLAVLLLPLVVGVVTNVPAFGEARSVISVLYLSVVASALSPTWLYLAFEGMWLLARINLGVNLAVIAAIFTLVRAPQDVLTYALILAFGPATASVAGLALAFRVFRLSPRWPRWQGILGVARSGFRLAFSQLAVCLYTTGNAAILGTFTSKEQVAYFAAADKVVRAVLRLISPLTTAIFPRMVRAASGSIRELMTKVRSLLVVYAGLGSVACLGLWAGAPAIIRWFYGPEFLPALVTLRVMSLIAVFIAASNVLGIHVLLPTGKDRVFTAITVAAGLANLAFARALVPRFQALGMAWSVVASEALVTGAMGVAVWKTARENGRGGGLWP